MLQVISDLGVPAIWLAQHRYFWDMRHPQHKEPKYASVPQGFLLPLPPPTPPTAPFHLESSKWHLQLQL
jgi:hypothetical protein